MVFKTSAIHYLPGNVLNTVRRFRFECLFALTGTWAAAELSFGYANSYISNDWYNRILMVSLIGLPLSLAVSLFTASRRIANPLKLVLSAVAAFVAFLFLFLLQPQRYPQDIVHFALLCLSAHLLVSFAAFLHTGRTLAFWQLNKTMFIRLLTGLLYSLVLCAGLSAAFATVDSIFGINLSWKYLRYTWMIIFGLFNTFYFLSGIPENIDQNEDVSEYPKGLKFFSQYILIPLSTVYLLILLVYELKILIEWQLPKGLVSALILGYAGMGLLALLLVYPIRDQEGNRWIKTFDRYFYLFLIPLVVLLILAVTKRVNSYGITQYRYFIMALAVWLLFLIGYFLLNSRATIKAIPISLFAMTMLINFGPQSATSVSLISQRHVLLALFKQERSVKDDKLLPIKQDCVNNYLAVRMASTLDYLLKHYHFGALQPLLSVNLARMDAQLRQRWNKDNNGIADDNGYLLYRNNWVEGYLHLGGYQYRQPYNEEQLEEEINAYYYIKSKARANVIKGYDYMLIKDSYPDTLAVDTLNHYVVKQRDNGESDSMILKISNKEFSFSAKDLANQVIKQGTELKRYEDKNTPQGLDKRYELPQQMLALTQRKAGIKVTAQIQDFTFEYTKKRGVKINSVRAYYLIKFE